MSSSAYETLLEVINLFFVDYLYFHVVKSLFHLISCPICQKFILTITVFFWHSQLNLHTYDYFTHTVEPEFYDHPFCQAKVVVNARWSLKTGSDVT